VGLTGLAGGRGTRSSFSLWVQLVTDTMFTDLPGGSGDNSYLGCVTELPVTSIALVHSSLVAAVELALPHALSSCCVTAVVQKSICSPQHQQHHRRRAFWFKQ
jgi:hypothetical protein